MKIEKYLQSSPIFGSYLLTEKLYIPFQKKLKEEGLTFIQSMILIAIYFEKSEVNPSQIAQSLQTSPSNLSHALKHLSNEDLVVKRIDKRDERKIVLELTFKGSKKVLKLIKLYNNIQNYFESEMSEKKLDSWHTNTQSILGLYGVLKP